MHLFTRRGQTYNASFTPDEATIISTFLTQIRAIVLGEVPKGMESKDLTQRVFPKASKTDRDLAQEFAELTTSGLKKDKAARLMRLADMISSGHLELNLEQAQQAIAALNDARLITAEICGLDQAAAALERLEPQPNITDAQGMYEETYRILSVLQITLVDALLENATPEAGEKQ